MRTMRTIARLVRCYWIRLAFALCCVATTIQPVPSADAAEMTDAVKTSNRHLLDAPMLFVKRHPYMAGHIYDDYYTWHPGGGIYVVENPADRVEKQRVRAVIDPNTPETLGPGVYRDPELSWDATRIVFAFKGAAAGMTSIYEIGVDGRGLRRLTASDKHHDVTPAYLPDGRIVFTSTRPRALVPCFNSGVDTLHVMEADGSDIRSISVNNVNEFDPAVLADGRVLYGRWEYVDKTALYMQSLWTVSPDGRMEAALFANNLAKPTAVLDARPVPDSLSVVAALTPHNGQAVGAIAMIDPRRGKNNLAAITNFTPEYPTEMDQGLRQGPSDPWALSEDVVLISNNAKGHGVIQLIDRTGNRELIRAEADISCYSPMLVKPRPVPAVVGSAATGQTAGRFLLADVYRGLEGVERGTIKRLRVIEETARTSGLPPGGRWWNQAFLVSWQGAYIVKNVLGTVPVHDDGSAYFEAPAGRALYFEALDAEGREVQRMRTFVQAVPGTTRSCVGCHENKLAASASLLPPAASLIEPAQIEPESWGNGYVDFPTMIQPILDAHCVECHGGTQGIEAGVDLSGGWTWAFNIAYETLIKHQLVGYLNCNNGSVHTTLLLKPGTIGSGAAPLAQLLIDGHDGRIDNLTRTERDLILAWMDTNSNYYGTWDYTPHATVGAVMTLKGPLGAAMQSAGCTECHAAGHVGNDWVNLQKPEWSRILRAPMAATDDGLGLGMCRQRKARTGYRLVDQGVQPPDFARPSAHPPFDPSGEFVTSIASTDDPAYETMLAAIERVRADALARPRIDMPGAAVQAGECRIMVPLPVPDAAPGIAARARADCSVELSWQRTAQMIGLQYELHRSESPQFTPSESTHLGLTTAGRFVDAEPPKGSQHYAMVVTSGTRKSRPAWTSIDVPAPMPPATPTELSARPLPGEVALSWKGPGTPGVRFNVFRIAAAGERTKLNAEPLPTSSFVDGPLPSDAVFTYVVRSLGSRGMESADSGTIEAAAGKVVLEPVFDAPLSRDATATLLGGKKVDIRLVGAAKIADGALDLRSGGHARVEHLPEFDVRRGMSVECWVRFDQATQMPVFFSCGAWRGNGWFLQMYTGKIRWYIGGTDCDGGRYPIGRWTHIVATYDGRQAEVFQDGKSVARVNCQANRTPHAGPMLIGQYTPSGGAAYQTTGRMKNVRIYHRPIRQAEAAKLFEEGRPVGE